MQTPNEIKVIVELTKKQLLDLYNGDCWVTDNFTTRIFPLKPEHAVMKVPGLSHSVAELVAHISAWRNFVVQKLSGNDSFDIRDEAADWPPATDWIAVLREFEDCQQQLVSAIDGFLAERWNSQVPGRSYSFIYLLTGIIQHDYYHYGQIGCVIAGLKKV